MWVQFICLSACLYGAEYSGGGDMITFVAGILTGVLLTVFTIILVCFYPVRDDNDWI